MEGKYIPILDVEEYDVQGISNDRMKEIIGDRTEKVVKADVDLVKDNMTKVVNNFLDAVEEDSYKSSSFSLDEIELSLSIGADGSVSIISSTVGVNVQTSVVLKFKKK